MGKHTHDRRASTSVRSVKPRHAPEAEGDEPDEPAAMISFPKGELRVPKWAAIFLLLPMSIAAFLTIVVVASMFLLFLFAPDVLSDRFTRAAPGINRMIRATYKDAEQDITFDCTYLFFVPCTPPPDGSVPSTVQELEKWLALKAGGFTRWSVSGGVERDAVSTRYDAYQGYFFLVSVRVGADGDPRIKKEEIEIILEQKCGVGSPTYVLAFQ